MFNSRLKTFYVHHCLTIRLINRVLLHYYFDNRECQVSLPYQRRDNICHIVHFEHYKPSESKKALAFVSAA